jgi:nitrogen-specific signal transduction histidine kinase
MPHPIIIFNENLMIVRANLSAKKLFQKRSDEFNGFALRDIDAQFSDLKVSALNEQKSGSWLLIGEWKAKILFRMDNRSYYILFK